MMKKLILFIALIMILSLILVGCGGKPANVTPEEVNTPKTEKPSPAAEEPITVEEDSAGYNGDFINPFGKFVKNNKAKDYYYEIETIIDDHTSHRKYWISGSKSRVEVIGSENEIKSIAIRDSEEEVFYFIELPENTVKKTNYEPMTNEANPNDNYIDAMKAFFEDPNDVKVENGSFENQPVKILTGIMVTRVSKVEKKHSVWLSTKNKFPLKHEIFKDDKLVETTLFKNLRVEPIDPSLFELPEGLEVID